MIARVIGVFAACAVWVACTGCNGPSQNESRNGEGDRKKTLKERICEGHEGNPQYRDPSVIASRHPGYSKAQYFEYRYLTKPPLDLNRLHYNLEEWRDRELLKHMNGEMKKMLKADFEANPNTWMHSSGLMDWLSKSNAEDPWPEKIAKVIDQKAVVDCTAAGLYRFEATIIVARKPLEQFEDVHQLVGRGVDRIMRDSLEPLVRNGSVTLNIPGELVNQLRALITQADMVKAIQRAGDQLRYVDNGSRAVIDLLAGDRVDVAPFDTAGYHLGGEMMLVLEFLTEAFSRVAEPSASYEMVVVGRADSRRLSSARYIGAADTSLGPTRRVGFAADQPNQTRELSNNQQLSVARGFAAAEFLVKELQQRKREDVRVLYGGDGEVPGDESGAARRLEIILRRIGDRR